MKFYAKDPVFFSDVSQELSQESSQVIVGQFSCLEDFRDLFSKEWIVVDDSLEPRDLISAMYTKYISHFVQKNPGHYSQDLRRAAGLVENPAKYFQSGYSFIEVEGATSLQIQFSDPAEKEKMLDEVSRFIEPISSAPAKEAAFAAIEELYMNAIFDAPKEARRLGLTVDNTKCELFLSFNQDTLQISCADPFGSLDLSKLFGRLHEVYQKGAGEAINLHGTGGAGIGCFLLFENCRSLIFGVQKGVQTKVTGLIPLNLSLRQRSKVKKSLHGFEVE